MKIVTYRFVVFAGILVGLVALAGNIVFAQYQKERPKAPTGEITLGVLKKQAKMARRQYPELFSFLEQRDAAIQKTLFEIADRIPNPETLPEIKIPESPVDEIVRPRSEAECRQNRDQAGLFSILPDRKKAQLHWYCVNGIYIRNTSIVGLAE